MIRPNQIAREITEIMHHIEILVEHCRDLIFPSTQGQELFGPRIGIHSSILPNSLSRSCARVADSKASKTGSSTSIGVILCGGFELDLKTF